VIDTQLLMTDRLASVGTLAAGMAHEINNPLAYVLGNVGFVADSLNKLLDPATDQAALIAEMQGALADTLEGARRVRDIVRDLHAFSNAEATTGTADVRRTVEASLRMVWGELKNRARLVVDVGRLPPVHGSDARLGHVFVNLLVNASQSFASLDAAENEISIRAFVEGDFVIVQITDTGRGMSEDVARKIFDPFFTTKAVGEGAGLGLFVSHSIVRSFGGQIDLESKLGHGATFRVRLPIARHVDDKSKPSSQPVPAGTLRVLVIDDEPRIGAVVKRMLARGFTVDVVTDAHAALELFEQGETFDVILCDVMLPTMSGIAFYNSIAPELRSRVILATAGAFTEEAQRFLESFRGRRLDKPFEREALRKTIQEVAAVNTKST
jgi:two-component system NtrC family sensor kinase